MNITKKDILTGNVWSKMEDIGKTEYEIDKLIKETELSKDLKKILSLIMIYIKKVN